MSCRWVNLPILHMANKTRSINDERLNPINACVQIKSLSFFLFESAAAPAGVSHTVTHRPSQALPSNSITEKASREWTIYNSDVISPSGCQAVGCKRLRTFLTPVFFTFLWARKHSSPLQGEPFCFSSVCMLYMLCAAVFMLRKHVGAVLSFEFELQVSKSLLFFHNPQCRRNRKKKIRWGRINKDALIN